MRAPAYRYAIRVHNQFLITRTYTAMAYTNLHTTTKNNSNTAQTSWLVRWVFNALFSSLSPFMLNAFSSRWMHFDTYSSYCPATQIVIHRYFIYTSDNTTILHTTYTKDIPTKTNHIPSLITNPTN